MVILILFINTQIKYSRSDQTMNIQCQKHEKKSITNLCFNQACPNKLLCPVCIEDHANMGHRPISLDQESKIFQQISRFSEEDSKHSSNIQDSYQNIIQKVNMLINRVEKFKDISLEQIRGSCKIIVNSFKKTSTKDYIERILNGTAQNRQIDLIVKAIKCFSKDNFKDAHDLDNYISCMSWKLIRIMDEGFNNISRQLSNIENLMNKYCVFEVNNHQELIQMIEKERIQQELLLRKKNMEQKIQRLTTMAHEKNWEKINNFLNQGHSVQQIEKIWLNASNERSANVHYTIQIQRYNDKIYDIELFSPCLNLKQLHLQFNNIRSMSPLNSLLKLQEVNLNGNKISSIERLSELKQLKILHLDHNQIERIQNLNDLTKLTHLGLQNNFIKKIQNLQDLTSLTHILLTKNKITKIQNLEVVKALKLIYLKQNNINYQDESNNEQIQKLRQREVKIYK